MTSTFAPNFQGEFRISYTRLQNNSYPISEGFDLASVGFAASLVNYVTYRQFPQILVQQYATGNGLAVATFGADEVTGLGGAGKNLLPQVAKNRVHCPLGEYLHLRLARAAV